MLSNNHLTDEELAICADAINSDVYDSLPEHIRKHIAECSVCANALMIISEVSLEVEKEISIINAPKHIRLKPWYIGIGSAAAASIVLFLLIEFYDLNSEKNNIQQITDFPSALNKEMVIQIMNAEDDNNPSPQDSTITEDKNQTLIHNNFDKKAMAYAPENNLEQLFMNMQGQYRSESIAVKTPDTLYINKSQIDTLHWQNPRNDKLIVEIFNNKAEEVMGIETNTESIIIPELSEGLYYWKLINMDFDLLYVGKIIVE